MEPIPSIWHAVSIISPRLSVTIAFAAIIIFL